MLIAAILLLNPIGLDVIYAALLSGEALSRSIWRPILLTGAAIMVVVVVLEWLTRKFIVKRRARLAATSS